MIRKAIIIAALLATVAAWADMEWQTAIGQNDQVTRGLVAYWAMRNSGTTVYDEWTGGYNGTASNGVTFGETYAAVGQGASFDGANDYVVVNAAVQNPTAQDVSVSIWVNIAKSQVQVPFAENNTTASLSLFDILIVADNTVSTRIRDSDGLPNVMSASGGTLTTNAWNHVVSTWQYATDTISIYVNGAFINSASDANVGTVAVTTATIGALINQSGINVPFNGQIDEVRLYNRALTADEIKQLYRMGAIPKGIK